MLSWAEERVERPRNIYLDNDAVVRAFAERPRAKEEAATKHHAEENN